MTVFTENSRPLPLNYGLYRKVPMNFGTRINRYVCHFVKIILP